VKPHKDTGGQTASLQINQQFELSKSKKGPIVIECRDRGELVCRLGISHAALFVAEKGGKQVWYGSWKELVAALRQKKA
jgi:hypothetical protein